MWTAGLGLGSEKTLQLHDNVAILYIHIYPKNLRLLGQCHTLAGPVLHDLEFMHDYGASLVCLEVHDKRNALLNLHEVLCFGPSSAYSLDFFEVPKPQAHHASSAGFVCV